MNLLFNSTAWGISEMESLSLSKFLKEELNATKIMVLGKKRWKLQEYSSFFPWPWLLNHRAGHTKTNTFFPRYISSFPIRIILETFRFPRTKLSLEIYLLHLHTGSLQHFDPSDRHNTSLRKSHIDRFSMIHACTTCLPPFCFRKCLEYELKT